MVRSSDNWKIEQQCPQCGAPVLLEETDRLFTCSFCRVRLFISPGDVFRYYIPPQDRSVKDVVFVPYWRFKGMTFLCRADRTEQRIVDATALAVDCKGLPHSLGVRPQAAPLRFVSRELEPHLFLPHRPFDSVFSWIEKRLLSVETGIAGRKAGGLSSEKVYHRAYIGETSSLIYLPVFIEDGSLYDAVTGRRMASMPGEYSEGLPLQRLQAGRLSFIPTLCPRCGWDLHGGKDSLVHLCRNCDTAWKVSGDGLEGLDFAVVPAADAPSAYLPFWRMKAGISGVRLRSYADLIRFANLPKAIQREWEEQEIHFWSPAFKVRPQLFQKSARAATNAQLPVESGQRVPKAEIFPATLPSEEALQGLKVTLFNMAVPKKNILPLIGGITITPEDIRLVLVPFQRNTHEFVQEDMHLSLNINALKFGRNL